MRVYKPSDNNIKEQQETGDKQVLVLVITSMRIK